MEENVVESHNRAVVYLDLLGFAALVEESPRHFRTAPRQPADSSTWPRNEAAERLAVFHRIVDSRIHAAGTTTAFLGNSTIVRSMFGGTSVVRAVTGESCGGKGMRIFVHDSFSEVYEQIRSEKRRRLEPLPAKFNSVSCEVTFVHGLDPGEISKLAGNIQQMANSAKAEFQHHYSETLDALSRMTREDPGRNRQS